MRVPFYCAAFALVLSCAPLLGLSWSYTLDPPKPSSDSPLVPTLSVPLQIDPNWLPKDGKGANEHTSSPISVGSAMDNESPGKPIRPFLVFVHYKENLDHLDWVRDYQHIIYNKGPFLESELHDHSASPAEGGRRFNIVHEFSNVGREAYIYLLFIIKHYHKLPALILFSQTDQPDRSVFNFDNDDFHSLVEELAQGTMQLKPENDGFAYLVPKCYKFWYGIVKPEAHHDFPVYFKDLLGMEIGNTRFQPFGCFVVRREVLLRQPLEYYQRLISTLNDQNDPLIGHLFEHAWSQVLHSNCSTSEEYFCGLDNLPEKC